MIDLSFMVILEYFAAWADGTTVAIDGNGTHGKLINLFAPRRQFMGPAARSAPPKKDQICAFSAER
ncbi:MAG: hypothetical protein ACE1ZY_04600 [Alphaproteobacteria bacterium]